MATRRKRAKGRRTKTLASSRKGRSKTRNKPDKRAITKKSRKAVRMLEGISARHCQNPEVRVRRDTAEGLRARIVARKLCKGGLWRLAAARATRCYSICLRGWSNVYVKGESLLPAPGLMSTSPMSAAANVVLG